MSESPQLDGATSTNVRVIYRWSVDPEQTSSFVDAWRHATQRILAKEPGAMGSTLLQPPDEPHTWIGLARWRSRADVEAFWARGAAVALPGATFQSAEVLHERVHLTIEDDPAPHPEPREDP